MNQINIKYGKLSFHIHYDQNNDDPLLIPADLQMLCKFLTEEIESLIKAINSCPINHITIHFVQKHLQSLSDNYCNEHNLYKVHLNFD